MIHLNQQTTVRAGPCAGKSVTVLEIDRLQRVAWVLLPDRSVEKFRIFEIGGKCGKNPHDKAGIFQA